MNIQTTLHALFEQQAQQQPNQVAVDFAGQSLSYAELNKKANQLAHYLRKRGIKADTPVGLCMERSIELLIAMLGILKAGGAYLPLDTAQPESRLGLILQDSKTALIIMNSKFDKELPGYNGQIIVLPSELAKIEQEVSTNPKPLAKPNNLAYIIYTSGSTGEPKGVLIEHQSVINYALYTAEYCKLKPRDRIDFSGNHCFDIAVTTSIVALSLGLRLIICSDKTKKNIQLYLNYLEHKQIAIIKLTPSYFKLLIHEAISSDFSLPALSTIIIGGEILSTADCASWMDLYPEQTIYNEYGPTEATVGISLYKIRQKDLKSFNSNVPIGKPLPNIECYILDASRQPVPQGEPGELYIAGVCLARAYLNQPKLSKEYFIKNPFSQDPKARLYKTGDLFKYLPDGNLEFLGRKDAQVKIRGFRVELAEIEKYLAMQLAISAVVVQAQRDHHNEVKLVAYYLLKEQESALTVSQIRAYLQKYIPNYMIPTAYVCMDKFPLTSNGKLDLSALPTPQFVSSLRYVAPRTSLEQTLAEIWAEELGLQSVGIVDNFFELGGHSLYAARIISTINHTLDKNLQLYDFYALPTIAQLAEHISLMKAGPSKPPDFSEYEHADYLPLNDFQFTIWMSNTFEPTVKKLNIVGRKRLHGLLDLKALEFAVAAVLRKYEILRAPVFKFRPAQKLQKTLSCQISQKKLTQYPLHKAEAILETSAKQLRDYYPWRQTEAALKLRVFYLKNQCTEIQIALPHLVSDESVPELIFASLSKFYLLYHGQERIPQVKIDKQYKYHLLAEQNYLRTQLDADLKFWESYLQQAQVYIFPEKQVVKSMRAKGIPYSTYKPIDEQSLSQLQRFCASAKVSMQDGLCAALLLALNNCSESELNYNHNILVNLVKSTRIKRDYTPAIGCFLRTEPILLKLDKNSKLAKVAQQAHLSVVETFPHQQCPSLAKLASIPIFKKQQSFITDQLISIFAYLYTSIFPTFKLQRKIFSLCGRLASFKRGNHFLINLNVHTNFFTPNKGKAEQSLFGLKQKKIEAKPYDLVTVDCLLDVCFMREPSTDEPYLVISSNLKPEFRERIAAELIRIIGQKAPFSRLREKGA